MFKRFRRFIGLLVTMFVLAGTLASAAQAQFFSATFDSTNEGFAEYQYDPNGEETIPNPATFVASDGNPGGFIRFDDPNNGVDEFLALFVSPPSGSPEEIGGTVSFDQRTNVALALGRPQAVALQGVTGDNVFVVYCEFAGPGSTWATYSATISPGDPCWRDGNDDSDATAADFQAAFGADFSAWQVTADFGTSDVEWTDLDNFKVEPPDEIVRELTIKYKQRSKAFKGALSQTVGPIGDGCVQSVVVELYQEGGENDTLIDGDVTDANGKWKIAKKAKKKKKYYASAAASGADPTCIAAESETIKPVT